MVRPESEKNQPLRIYIYNELYIRRRKRKEKNPLKMWECDEKDIRSEQKRCRRDLTVR